MDWQAPTNQDTTTPRLGRVAAARTIRPSKGMRHDFDLRAGHHRACEGARAQR